VRGDTLEEGVADRRGDALEQLLDDSVADVIAGKLRVRKMPWPDQSATHLGRVFEPLHSQLIHLFRTDHTF
jgi:hypothetical protein